MNVHHIEPVVEILAEAALLDHRLEVAIGGGDDAGFGAQRLGAADPLVGAFLEYPQQFRLQGEGHLSQLVEEQGAVGGQLEASLLARRGAGEATLLVTEQLAFQNALGQRRAIDRQEDAGASRMVVDGLGDHLLAGAALAGDEHRGVACRRRPARSVPPCAPWRR